jgi:hypothetical protein
MAQALTLDRRLKARSRTCSREHALYLGRGNGFDRAAGGT